MSGRYENDTKAAQSKRLAALDGWFARYERPLFMALIFIHLIPIYGVEYLPSLDGPAHLSITDILVRYRDPGVPVFREFYELNFGLNPTYFVYVVLYGLMQVLSPLIAEKVLLSAYVVLLPLALRYAVRAIGARLTQAVVSARSELLEGCFSMMGYTARCGTTGPGLMVLARAVDVSRVEIATGNPNGYPNAPTRWVHLENVR